MASPFSMLSIISKSRRSSRKQIPSDLAVPQDKRRPTSLMKFGSKKGKKESPITQDDSKEEAGTLSVNNAVIDLVPDPHKSEEEKGTALGDPTHLDGLQREVQATPEPWTELPVEREPKATEGEKFIADPELVFDENDKVEQIGTTENGTGPVVNITPYLKELEEKTSASVGSSFVEATTPSQICDANASEQSSTVKIRPFTLEEQHASTLESLRLAHEKIAEMEHDNAEKDRKIDTLEKGDFQAKEEIRHIRADMDLLKEELAKKNTELESLEQQRATTAGELQQVRGTVGRLHKEIEEDLKALLRLYSEKSSIIQQLQDSLHNAKEDLESERSVSAALEKEAVSFKEQLEHTLQQLVDTKTAELSALAAIDTLEMQCAERERNLQIMHTQLKSIGRQNRMLEDQLRQQSEQLQIGLGSPSHPRHGKGSIVSSRVDSKSSGTAIQDSAVRVMNALNSEIFQTAAFITDTLETENQWHPSSPVFEGKGELEARMVGILGSDMIKLLLSSDSELADEPDSLLMQIALQTCTAFCCERIIKSWYPGHWEYGDFLAVVYSRLAGMGSANDTTNWRSMTRSIFKQSSTSVSQMSSYITSQLADVLIVAGWANAGSDVLQVLSAFQEHISTIAKFALRLNAILGDDGSIEPLLFAPNLTFQPETMENAYPEKSGDVSASGKIMCTTDVGLQKVFEREGAGHARVILRPKVVLHSSMVKHAL